MKTLDQIRSEFPALLREHNSRPVAYFDGPGGTQTPRAVVEAMSDYLYHHNANTHWSFPTSNETDEILNESRSALADFLNASPTEIVFGQNMTSLAFHLARALGRDFSAGDEIIVTDLDHHANIDTWRSLEKDRGVVIRVAPVVLETMSVDFGALAELLNSKTKLLAIGAASNAVGSITDVVTACSMARANGTLSFVDAVHFAAHNLVDVKQIGCDFLACSAYKFYGPHIGVLFGREDLLDRIDFPKLRPAPSNSPERAETGTQSHESIAGAAAAVNFLASTGDGPTRRTQLESAFAEIHDRKAELFDALWNGLKNISGVTVYGREPDQERTPTIAFTVAGLAAETVSRELAERAVFTSHGDFYASTVVQRLGLAETGLVRAGLACYTTPDEISRLVSGVAEIAATAN